MTAMQMDDSASLASRVVERGVQGHFLGGFVTFDMPTLRVKAAQPGRIEPTEASPGRRDKQASIGRSRRYVSS
ncbi:hypothetical protein MESS4_p40098 [Mesorhizobium sp. STM 4661]|nr:hypothetical protein MESS4_p40098 [Mesorhizobium sp. STM 4661]